ncbi:hypothetical protein M3576_08960 [Weizmannia ginsengihumi]|nr:hypothetical protein [Heyndrickxia ginsengihumi]
MDLVPKKTAYEVKNMLLYFPNKFDENEWTILIVILFNLLILMLLPKKIPKEITPLIALLSISYPKIMDHSMAVKPYNLYNLTDSGKYELFDLALYAVYPAFGYLFVYFLEYVNVSRVLLVVYIVAWSIIGVAVEYLFVILHVFIYTGWKLIYSLPIYLIVIAITYVFYQIATYYHKKESNNQS